MGDLRPLEANDLSGRTPEDEDRVRLRLDEGACTLALSFTMTRGGG